MVLEDGGMHIVIFTPYGIDEPRGNSIAAKRLRDGFIAQGHDTLVLDRCAEPDRETPLTVLHSFRPDVGLVMHGWRCARMFHTIKSVSSMPLVVSLRGTDLNEMMEDPERGPVIGDILRRCDGITLFSREARERLARGDRSLLKKTRIIPNGIDLPGQAGQVFMPWGSTNGDALFIGVAGVREVKNLPWLVESLKAVRQKGLDIHYVHAGPVLDETEGKRFHEICSKEPWIRYAGDLPREQIPRFLGLGHVFVSASRSEGMPHAVREAMLAGLPCLLSDIPGHRSLARPGREALFFRDRGDFVEKAATLARDPVLRERLKKGGRERAGRLVRNGKEITDYIRFFSTFVQTKG